MNVLIVGGGGREHAIAWALSKSEQVEQLYCAPGNGGIAALAQCVPLSATDVDGVVAWAQTHSIDFVVVAPDDPLALGMVDALEDAGIPAFGPRADAAIIEASKIFSKNLMAKYHIPTAKYQTFTELAPALAYIEAEGAPIVVKADGLALGKGVIVAQTVAEAQEAVRSMMDGRKFGQAGARVVIEECMTGPEVTVLAFCDGEHLVPMPSSQDHKRAFDGNQGPNTGGMGAISPSPNYTPEVARRCMEEIFLPTVAALKAEGRPFQGVLYFGLMLTSGGPKVVEYNARFGDPECQAVLSLLETDLLDIFLACRNGTLDHLNIRPCAGLRRLPRLLRQGSAHHRPGGCRTAGRGFPCGHQTGRRRHGVHQRRPGAGRHRHRAGSERRDRQRLRRRGAHPLPGHALPHRHWPGLKPLRPKGCYFWLSNWMLRLVASIRAVLLR